jgi:hypothetical protein
VSLESTTNVREWKGRKEGPPSSGARATFADIMKQEEGSGERKMVTIRKSDNMGIEVRKVLRMNFKRSR